MQRLLLVDDHEVMRTGLKLLLNQFVGLSVIDEAWDGDSAMEKVTDHDYHLVILDVNMPATDSSVLLKSILKLKPQTRVLMFSMNPSDIFAKRYLSLGAYGYIAKDENVTEIKNAVTTILNKGQYFSSAFREKLISDIQNKIPNPFAKLTAREFEIAKLLGRGESLTSISNILDVPYQTVATSKARIFAKLHCKNVVNLLDLIRLHKVLPEEKKA